jgi:hypothetical protein
MRRRGSRDQGTKGLLDLVNGGRGGAFSGLR